MTDSRPNPSARVPPEKLDTIDLWKYFESRGQELKTAMLSLATWLTGFTAAALAFSLEKAMKFDAGFVRVSNPLLLVLMGLVGLGLVIYALIVVYEYADHITRTFDRSDKVRNLDSSLDPILGPRKPRDTPKFPAVCAHVRNVVGAFGLAFVVLLVLGLVSIFGGGR
jgi:hypothetical protein